MGKTPQAILDSNQRWRDRNRERHLANARAYHHANRDTLLVKKREHWAANADEINLNRRLRKFGLAMEEYLALEVSQGWACFICTSDDKLVIDHCHETGKVRALLCSNCNTALGLLKEDPTIIERLMHYAEDAAMMKAQAMVAKGAPGQGAQ